MLFCRLLIFFPINFFKIFFQEYYQSVKQFQSRAGPTFVGPDLGPNCLQMLSADNTGRKRVKAMPKDLTNLPDLPRLVSSAENLYKQFGSRSGPTKLFATLMVILKEFFEKVNFEKCSRRQKTRTFPSMQKVNPSPISVFS